MLRFADFALVAARLLLSFVFLLAGSTKLVDPGELRKAWTDFGLPAALARPASRLLPVLELTVAAALVPTSLAWYGAWAALALLAAFVLAVGIAMLRGRTPDCRCFGRLHSAPVGRPTLIRDAVLAACAGGLVWSGPRRVGPDVWAWLVSLDSHQRKIALVSACVAGFLFLRLLDRSRPDRESIESQRASAPDEEPPEEARPAPAERRAAPHRPVQAPRRVEPESRVPPEPAPPARIVQGIGLATGTPAPDFQLPAMTGETHSLRSLREQGREILLVFSSPYCDPCRALAPKLVRWTREMDGTLNLVVVSRGSVADNRAKLKDLDPARVLLQRGFDIAEAYDCNATPAAVLVGADGLIRSALAVGGAAIQQLITSSAKRAQETTAG